MIQLHHIKELEKKIETAISTIRALRGENGELKVKLDSYQKRISELEVSVSKFKEDQSAIEKGILQALKQLDELEDIVTTENETENHAPDTPPSVESPIVESPLIEPAVSDDVETDSEQSENGDAELDIF